MLDFVVTLVRVSFICESRFPALIVVAPQRSIGDCCAPPQKLPPVFAQPEALPLALSSGPRGSQLRFEEREYLVRDGVRQWPTKVFSVCQWPTKVFSYEYITHPIHMCVCACVWICHVFELNRMCDVCAHKYITYSIHMCVCAYEYIINLNWIKFVMYVRMIISHIQSKYGVATISRPYNYRSLGQNIVSFIGLFCKRDLYF